MIKLLAAIAALAIATPASADISLDEFMLAQAAANQICPAADRITNSGSDFVAEIKFQSDVMHLNDRERLIVFGFCNIYLQGHIDALANGSISG